MNNQLSLRFDAQCCHNKGGGGLVEKSDLHH